MSDRIYEALILNEPYADWVKQGRKLIETRMNKRFSFRGDIVICCDKGKSKKSKNAGKALCIVDLWKVRTMRDSDEHYACIGNAHGRISHLLRDWRHFSRDFEFSPVAIKKNFQGMFSLRIPDDVEIIPRPDIIPFREFLSPQEAYKMIKEDDTYDFLRFDLNKETWKWDVWVGNRKETVIESFDEFDGANDFVNATHEIVNRIKSARQLRSFF